MTETEEVEAICESCKERTETFEVVEGTIGDNFKIKGIVCAVCRRPTTFVPVRSVTVTFKCRGCGQEKDAKIETVYKKALNKHHCSKCGEETVWEEQGWVNIVPQQK